MAHVVVLKMLMLSNELFIWFLKTLFLKHDDTALGQLDGRVSRRIMLCFAFMFFKRKLKASLMRKLKNELFKEG